MTFRAVKTLVLTSAIALISLYVYNPSGTATTDPRGRILGIVPYHIPSGSMEPTLNVGNYILASTYAYRNTPIKRNDIVVFKYPPAPKQDYVKRVIGVSGDKIAIENHALLLNGTLTSEPFTQHIRPLAKPTPNNIDKQWVVPVNHVFVMGDNRDNSSDSRDWGFVSVDAIIGKVNYVLDAENWHIDNISMQQGRRSDANSP